MRGDTQARFIKYGQSLRNLYCIVYSPKHLSLVPKQLSNNVWVYPTNSTFRIAFLRDAYRIAGEVIRNNPIDLVSTQDPFATGLIGYALKKSYHLPLNVQLFSSFLNNQHWLSERKLNILLQVLAKWILMRADTIRVESLIEKELLTNIGVEETKIWTVPLFYDFDRFIRSSEDKDMIRKKLLEDYYLKLVLFVGRLSREKDIPTLLRAASIVTKSYPQVRFIIVGSGPEEVRLKGIVSDQLLKNVMFLGHIHHDDIPRVFQACDVFALTSTYEGIPTVVVEAALCKKPVVVTQTRNITDVVVDGKTGFVVPQKDYQQLAKRILYLLENPISATEMGEEGQRIVLNRFNPEGLLKQLIKMWEKTGRKDFVGGIEST